MKLIKKTIGFLGDTLVTTGEIGLTIFGITYLWITSKIGFAIALALVGIITAIDKIKDSKKSGE